MKVPLNLQYALTRNCNKYLVKNLNRQVFTRDPANVFGRNSAMDVGVLRKKTVFAEVNDDKVTVVSHRRTGRVTRRRNKKSGLNSQVRTVTRRELKSLKSLGGKLCRMELWKVNRLRRAQRRAQRISAMEEK